MAEIKVLTTAEAPRSDVSGNPGTPLDFKPFILRLTFLERQERELITRSRHVSLFKQGRTDVELAPIV